MNRVPSPPRPHWAQQVEAQGLVFHTNADGSPYWEEDACYQLSLREVERIESAANELHQMFLEACGTVITHRQLDKLGVPAALHALIERSWEEDAWELYGRFDLTLTPDGTPKLIEYNADTPSGLLEASLIQWYWKEEVHPGCDQFNSLHESLVARWRELIGRGQIAGDRPLHLTCVAGHQEDRMTAGYVGETAEEAGLQTRFLPIDEIGVKTATGQFVDASRREIAQLFKLYPWEWLGVEEFRTYLPGAAWRVVEPPWKALCSNKGLLLVLAALYPGHPYLLPVATDPGALRSHVKKPFIGREGQNVEIVIEGRASARTEGVYGDGLFVYQEYAPLIQTPGAAGTRYAQLGVWMIGPEAHGLGIREDGGPILTNTSRFVPHVIV